MRAVHGVQGQRRQGKVSGRLGYVDGLRALAALYVVAYHMGLEFWPDYIPSGPMRGLGNALNNGHEAVSVFIVLSGFSLMLPVARNANRLPGGALVFYKRRARRILPPYYLALLFSLLLIWLFVGQKTGTHWDVSVPVTWQGVVAHLLLIQDFSATADPQINHALWSVALECQIYLLFPVLLLLWRRYHPLFATFLTVFLSLALWPTLDATWLGYDPGFGVSAVDPQYLGLFGLGMLAATLVDAPPRYAQAFARWRGWEVTFVAGLAFLPWALAFVSIIPGDLDVGLTTMAALLAASRLDRYNPLRAVLEWRPLVWIGGFSYSLYLIHAPLIQLIWQYAVRPLGLSVSGAYWALLLGGLPLIVMTAWGFWYVCERPFLNSATRAAQMNKREPVAAEVA
jgi:peptidoglycan/LPS O-acetylase OafA/YrhL